LLPNLFYVATSECWVPDLKFEKNLKSLFKIGVSRHRVAVLIDHARIYGYATSAVAEVVLIM